MCCIIKNKIFFRIIKILYLYLIILNGNFFSDCGGNIFELKSKTEKIHKKNKEKMTKKILTFAMLTALFLNSCKESPKKENKETSKTETVEKTVDEIVKSSSTDKDGKKLEMTFNNTKDLVIINFNGETMELVGQKPASGIWYKNDHYELTGKGENVVLKKDGKTIFEK